MIKADQKKASARRLKQFKVGFNFWITAVLVSQVLKVSKAVIKTLSKFKNDTEKFDFNLMLFDSLFKIIVKHTCQN